jgi:hypothetical protein
MNQLQDIHVAVTCQGTYFTLEMDSTISPWPKEKLEWGMIDLVVSDKKIFKISANENTLWILAAMLDFKSAPKTQIW